MKVNRKLFLFALFILVCFILYNILKERFHLWDQIFGNKGKIKWGDTIDFVDSIENSINKGVVVQVYDGDSITIASKLPYEDSPLYRFKIRLRGVDSPELFGKDENENLAAQIAKKELFKIAMYKMVTLKNIGRDVYGRVVADAYIGDLHLNRYMIEKRLAVPMEIRECEQIKNSPKNWLDYYYTGEF